MSVFTQRHEGWAEVVLNRPAQKNAIDGELGLALSTQLLALNADDSVRAVVLRGADGAFCSGLDLKAFNAEPPPAWLADFQTIWRSAHNALFNFSKPIVGAMERYAINGGAALALACDYLIVGESAFLQVGEIKIGMGAPYNLAWLSLRHSEATMAELALLGDRVLGPQLVDARLAQQCVADDQVLACAAQMASQLAGYPAAGPLNIKAGLRARVDSDADTWFDRFTQAGVGSAKPSSMASAP